MSIVRHSVFVLTALAASATTHAGRVADLFSEGLLGLTWGASREQIESSFPGGKWKRFAAVEFYWVADTRAVLNIERGNKSRIGFALNSDGKLTGVSIEFAPGSLEKWSELLLKAQEAFGPMRRPDLAQTAVAGTVIAEWEDDAGVKVVASSQPGFGRGPLTLSVSKVNFDQPKSKAELGFQ